MAEGRTSSVTRRALIAGASGLWIASSTEQLLAKPKKMIGPLAVSVAVAELDGKPVVSDASVRKQISEAVRLMKPHGLTVELVEQRTLTEKLAKLENADDRDAVAAHLRKHVINAFICKSIRDIDETDRFIQGVRWRKRSNLLKDYVIVSSIASDTTLTHELGHFLGNGHSGVVNNVMSYKRDDPSKIHFDKKQGAKMRRVAQRLLRLKRVLTVADYKKLKKKKKKKKNP